jgi:hypothetical protein
MREDDHLLEPSKALCGRGSEAKRELVQTVRFPAGLPIMIALAIELVVIHCLELFRRSIA